jgi:hypothetical protein
VDNVIVDARTALLDALAALNEHRDQVIVVGAQAVYLRTGGADVAVAEFTKDSDLAVDPRGLANAPLLEDAMRRGGFYPAASRQPGAWVNRAGIPVDLMVPDALSEGSSSHRAGWIGPHSRTATRRAVGLEASVVNNDVLLISALDPSDTRIFNARVAGPAALLIAKLHKIDERRGQPHRLNDKDAHDVYRLLVATTDMTALGATFQRLLVNPDAGSVTQRAIDHLPVLFADGPDAIGSIMAGRAEEGIGDPELVAASVAALAADLFRSIVHTPGS